jgi:uncharacterized protein YjbI with pentapeptide repeats
VVSLTDRPIRRELINRDTGVANAKLLALVRQGRGAFRKWRRKHPKVILDLMDADLAEIDLRGANLRRADLIGINLTDADLSTATLSGADLTRSKLVGVKLLRADLSKSLLSFADLKGADLTSANLRGADLSRTELMGAVLAGADLTGARLCNADLSGCDLRRASLKNADLTNANLTGSDLSRADLSDARLNNARLDKTDLTDANLNRTDLQATRLHESLFGWTSLGNVDLSGAQGLDTVNHLAPSSLGIDSLCRSQGKLAEAFLRGCGVSAEWMAQIPTLAEESSVSPVCFLSFSEPDRPIAKLLQDALGEQGIRCWLHGKPEQRDEAVGSLFDREPRLWDKLLLCASSNSLCSWWVDDEISAAFEREEALTKERGKETQVLLPIIVDGYIHGGSWQSVHTKPLYERLAIDFSKCRRDKQRFDQEIGKVVQAVRDHAESAATTAKGEQKKEK